MNRINIYLAALTLAFIMNGCTKEDPSKPLDVDMKSTEKLATVKGTILYVTDIYKAYEENNKLPVPSPAPPTVNYKYEAPPKDKIVITATIKYEDIIDKLTGTANANDPFVISNWDYDPNTGEFTIKEIPVGMHKAAGAKLTISVAEFQGTFKEADKNNKIPPPPTGTTPTTSMQYYSKTSNVIWYMSGSIQVDVFPGQTSIAPLIELSNKPDTKAKDPS